MLATAIRAAGCPRTSARLAIAIAARIASATRLISAWANTVPSTSGKRRMPSPARRATRYALAGSPKRPGMIAEASTPTIVARTTIHHPSLTSGSAARRTARHETARRSIDSEFRASAATSHHGCTLLRDLPIRANPTPESASAINPASASTPSAAPERQASRLA
jgi:hypothetical protein